MDDVSGLADKSEELSSFLTVAGKFGYSCVYIFHIIYLEKAGEWSYCRQKILTSFATLFS